MNKYYILKEIKKKILLLDGAMGTEIQKYNLTKEDYGGYEGCNEYLIMTKPDIIRNIHKTYLDAGADIIETNTFGANQNKLDEYNIEELTYEINYKAARNAKDITEEMSTPDKPRFVLGSIGPSGFLPSSNDPDLGNIGFDKLSSMFDKQIEGLIKGGVDGLLIETTQDILELKAIVNRIKKYLNTHKINDLPIIAQITLDTNGKMLLGTDIAAALTSIETMGVDIIGINCSTGPQHMRGPVQYLSSNTKLPISCLPNAGLPINKEGQAVYPLSSQDMKKEMQDFVYDFGINIIGGCCGTTPQHIKELAELKLIPKKRNIKVNERTISSSIKNVSLTQEPAPLFVGERLNSQGSRKVKRLLLDDDYDGLLKIATEQIEYGAHVLDICVALTERTDEADTIRRLTKKLSLVIEAPLMFDSTDPAVIEAALKQYPGSPIINSINLENGEDQRLNKMISLAKEYGTSTVALTIDEKGMATVKERKIDIAKRLYNIYTKAGLDPKSLIVDVLTFTLATGEDQWKESAIETLRGINLIKKELPECHSILGLSNVSFGLKTPARKILNSCFLYYALNEGLDSVIINPAHVIAYNDIEKKERSLAENLIFNKNTNALIDLINHFEKQENKKDTSPTKEKEKLPIEEIIHSNIVKRRKDGIENLIDEALEKYEALTILNSILLPAMKEVGALFASGELILPFVLQSAEVMKKAVAYLEQFLEKTESSSKGSILLATVYGDVHDIGKNLVKTILTNNGYTVHDLGKQVPVNTIIDMAVKLKVDAIGLSALLVSTSKQMGLCIKELSKRNYSYPVLIGGAAINKQYGMQISFIDDMKNIKEDSIEQSIYNGAVFYAKDAFEGLDIMENIINKQTKEKLILKYKEELKNYKTSINKSKKINKQKIITIQKSNTKAIKAPKPPFFGHKVIIEKDINIKEVFQLLPLPELFRLSWGGRGMSKEKYKSIVESEFKPTLDKLKKEFVKGNYLKPKIIYSYLPCDISDDDKLRIYNTEKQKEVIEEFNFPRQNNEPFLSITDYFKTENNEKSLIVFQVVSLGNKITTIIDELNEKEEYQKAFYVHGLSVQTAEALTAYSHQKILQELGLNTERGKRYSFGYPACPDLADQKKIMKLMPVEEEMGVSLTEGFLLIPEQSTSSFIIHHPDASYFRVI